MSDHEISITENTPAQWQQFSDRLDCVPDPMTIRTAELFLNGKSGCGAAGLDAETVWQTIDGNLHGLFTFFSALMTRPAIPLIAYFETFHQDESLWPVASRNIVELLVAVQRGLLISVHVDKKPYEQIRNAARDKLKELDLATVSPQRAQELSRELVAYQYDWKPNLGDLEVTDDYRPIAHFLLGGLIFGAYAEASDADHLIQSRRSGLFASLTKPGTQAEPTTYDREEEVFADLKRTCMAAPDAVRVDELPAMPSVLADLLLRHDPPVRDTRELLSLAIEVRQSPAGLALLEWFKQLRGALGNGTYATSAKQDIQRVQKEADERLRGQYSKWGMTMTPSVSASLSVISAKLQGQPIRIGIPDWIRNWMVDRLPFGRHRKLLLRWTLAHAEFRDISRRIRRLWEAS